jgi:hypothetical protein
MKDMYLLQKTYRESREFVSSWLLDKVTLYIWNA